MPAQERPASGIRKWRFAVGGAIIALAILYLVLSSAEGTAVYALTIQELAARSPAIYGRGVRVSGTVDGRTIAWHASESLLEFNLVDAEKSLPVTFRGARPDMFRDGAQAVVEGMLRPSGVFEATKLLLQCPSKYETEATMTATR
jgi:cytochrome c-type biogenesis protein CcmE